MLLVTVQLALVMQQVQQRCQCVTLQHVPVARTSL
jgi:hypothetical protein